MKVRRLPQALIDLVDVAEHIAEDNVAAADRFFDAFERTIELIKKTPQIGSVRVSRNYGPIRMWFVNGFEKCLIFYTENDDEVVILRLIHASRDYNNFI